MHANTFPGRASTLATSYCPIKREKLTRPALLLGLVLLLAGSAWADIECKEVYEPNEPIVVKVAPTGVPEGAKLRGSLQVTDAKYLQPDASEGTFYVWAGEGTHTISASGVWVLTEDVQIGEKTVPVLVDFGQYTFTRSFVVWEGDDPVPPPIPEGTRWAVIWEETEQRTPQQGNLFLQLRKEFQDERLLIQDVTNLPQSLRALESQRPQNLPLPVLAVFVRQKDGTDKVVRHVPLPSSVGGVKQEVAK